MFRLDLTVLSARYLHFSNTTRLRLSIFFDCFWLIPDRASKYSNDHALIFLILETRMDIQSVPATKRDPDHHIYDSKVETDVILSLWTSSVKRVFVGYDAHPIEETLDTISSKPMSTLTVSTHFSCLRKPSKVAKRLLHRRKWFSALQTTGVLEPFTRLFDDEDWLLLHEEDCDTGRIIHPECFCPALPLTRDHSHGLLDFPANLQGMTSNFCLRTWSSVIGLGVKCSSWWSGNESFTNAGYSLYCIVMWGGNVSLVLKK